MHGMGRARKLDPHLSIPMVGDALRKPMHLTKDVDRAGVQREAIKLIKGTECMSCEEVWRTGGWVEKRASTWKIYVEAPAAAACVYTEGTSWPPESDCSSG